MPRIINELNEKAGISRTDIANIAGVSNAAVSRWHSNEANPQPITQRVLADLGYIVDRLREYYTTGDIRGWLYARHPQLDGLRAVDLITQNRATDVLRVLDRLCADVYI